jgi:L-serine dehydratase
MFTYNAIDELVKAAEAANTTISRVVLDDQAESEERGKDELFAQMKSYLDVMRQSAEKGAAKDIRSKSGLTGGAAWALSQYNEGAQSLLGSFSAHTMARAVAVAEYNAAMGKIVAAPTAGSCGIIPAAVLTMMDERGASEDAAVMSLFLSGGFGMVIMNQASIAGAEGGCQAECGSASGLAAACLVELSGGTPRQCAAACNVAITNLMGLVCDPVAGLVEVPCVMRNAGAVVNAVAAADIALSGFEPVIPIDEVIGAMREVGNALPPSLRETAQGGLAATPTGMELKRKIFAKPAPLP